MANDGSSPQCCSATVSIDVVEVLPAVPVTRGQPPAGGQRGQRLRPVHHGQSALARRGQLRVGARIAEDTTTVAGAAGRWAGVVPDLDAGAERPQGEHGARLLGVRAGHRRAPGQQDPGDAAHPGTADADQVHPVGQRHGTGAGRAGGAARRVADSLTSAPRSRRAPSSASRSSASA